MHPVLRMTLLTPSQPPRSKQSKVTTHDRPGERFAPLAIPRVEARLEVAREAVEDNPVRHQTDGPADLEMGVSSFVEERALDMVDLRCTEL